MAQSSASHAVQASERPAVSGRCDPDTAITDPFDELAWLDFRRSRVQRDLSKATIDFYGGSVAQLALWLAEHRPGVTLVSADHRAVGDYLVWVRQGRSAGTVKARYRALSAFYGWLLADGQVTANPLARCESPRGKSEDRRVLQRDEISAALKAAAAPRPGDLGRGYLGRLRRARDYAIFSLWADLGGYRVAEMAGMRLGDFNPRRDEMTVTGKGDKSRTVPVAPETAHAISRYLRIRAEHPAAHRYAAPGSALWLGKYGPMTASGIRQMCIEVCGLAGLGHVYPHMWRHTSWHWYLMNDGTLNDGMVLYGWSVTEMALHYGKSASAHRALQLGRRIDIRSGL